MAKIKGPLLSVGAHGSIADILNYSKRQSGQQARKHHRPLVAPTGAQRGQRRLTEFLVAHWQNMSAADRATWETNAKASGLGLTGYHYFLRTAQRDLYTHHGLCGYWHCNEIVGGKVLDISGKGNHGTLQPAYPANAPILVDSYNTRFNKALRYDGVDEYVNCGTGGSPSVWNLTNRGSVELWFKHAVAFANGSNITALDLLTIRVTFFYFSLSSSSLFYFLDDGLTECHSNRTSWDTNWHHVTITDDGTTLKMYIDSILQAATGDATLANFFATSGNFYIAGTSEDFNGIIDEVCVYNRALSAAEILTRYKFATRKI